MSDAGKIHAAMIAAMRDVGAIGKDSVNQMQKFNFRGIDAVYNTLHRIMGKHGIYSTSEVLASSRDERTTKTGTVLAFVSLHMRYRFFSDDGSSVTTEVVGEGMDSGDKATNKAMAVAHKYALLQAFMVPTEQTDDPDAETHEVKPLAINEAQAAELWELIKLTNANVEGFCKHFDCESVETMQPKAFATALASLKKKAAAMQAAA